MESLSFTAYGVPEPKGSARAFAMPIPGSSNPKGGPKYKAVVTTDNPDSKRWQELIRGEAQIVMGRLARQGTEYQWFDSALTVTLLFYFSRPPSLTEKKRPLPTVKPDIDKLARTVLDGMTGVFYRDDAQITDLVVRKRYLSSGTPRVDVVVAPPSPELFT